MKSRIERIQPVLASNDLAASVNFYRRLGFAVCFQDDPDRPKYVAMTRDGIELHLQWADSTQWMHPVDRPACRFLVADVDAIYKEFVENSLTLRDAGPSNPWAAPADTPWGTREFHLRDPGQNSLQFYRPLRPADHARRARTD